MRCIRITCTFVCVSNVPVEAPCCVRGRRRCWRKPARSGWPEAEAPYGKGGVYLIRSLWRNKTARSVEKKDPKGTKYTQQDGLIREKMARSNGRPCFDFVCKTNWPRQQPNYRRFSLRRFPERKNLEVNILYMGWKEQPGQNKCPHLLC